MAQQPDYDTLASQHGGVVADVDYDALAAAHGGATAPAMNFAIVNGERVPVEQGTLSKAWDVANTPLLPQIADAAHAVAEHLGEPALDRSKTVAQIRGFLSGATDAAGNIAAGFTSPVGIVMTLATMGEGGVLARSVPALKSLLSLPAVRVLQKSVQAMGGAAFAAHGAERIIDAPTLGAKAQGVAEMATGALGVTSAMRTGRVPSAAPAPLRADEAAVAWGQGRNIPIDAGTATENLAVKGAQFLSDRTLAGSVVAKSANRATADALAREGGALAQDARGVAVTPEQAGQGIRDALTSKLEAHTALADHAYERLRALEADPANRMRMPLPPQAVDKLPSHLQGQLRRIVHELDASGYSPSKLVRGAEGDRDHYVPRSGGAKVYDDITQNLGHTPTRGAIQEELEAYLGGGKETAAVRAAIAVAKERYMGRNANISTPELPASAMQVPTRLEGARVTSQEMGLPVDVTAAKAALRPVYDQMMRQLPVTQQQANPGLKAIGNILDGPDMAPLSQVDRDLSAIKAIARTQGGLAKFAVSKLEAAVKTAANYGTPDVLRALEQGRKATISKVATEDLIGALPGGKLEEPLAVFRRATAPKDSAIEFLRAVKEHTPQALPQIARAKLDELLSLATEKGGFEHTDKLYAEWQKLGSETKKILFPQVGHTQALDHFFLLAKRLNENVNPSGSGAAVMHLAEVGTVAYSPLVFISTQVGSAGLSTILHTRAGVNALTRLLSMQAKSSPATLTRAARTAGWLDVVHAARAAGVNLAVPAAAQSTPSGEQR